MDAILIKEQIESRQDCNRAILEILTLAVEKLPNWRMHQILQNFGVTDKIGTDLFYEESIETLEKMLNNSLVNNILSKE